MNEVSSPFLIVAAVTAWLAGIALANGIINTLIAIFLPFVAWYFVVEKILLVMGWLDGAC